MASKAALEWHAYVQTGMVTSGRNTVFPFMNMEDTKKLNLQEGFNSNLHLFDAILNYILHQTVPYTVPEGVSPTVVAAIAARAQCAHFRFWFRRAEARTFHIPVPDGMRKAGTFEYDGRAAASSTGGCNTSRCCFKFRCIDCWCCCSFCMSESISPASPLYRFPSYVSPRAARGCSHLAAQGISATDTRTEWDSRRRE